MVRQHLRLGDSLLKISSIEAIQLEAELSQEFRWSFDSAAKRTSCLVKITTDEGIVGWGECFGPASLSAAVVRFLAPFLVGQSALATEKLWEFMYNKTRDQGRKGVPICAISGIDIALWDVRGKYYNAPISQLLGGPMRTSLPAYATGTYRVGDAKGYDYIIDEVVSYKERGFTGVKLKIGLDIEEDCQLIADARSALGDEMHIMLDANHGYDVLDAIEVGKRAAEHRIVWFEEPVVPDDLHMYRTLRSKQPIPVAGGETEFTRWGFRDVLQAEAMDIIQPDTCAAGGISECKKIADMAAAYGVRYYPHVWGTSIGMSAALQILSVLPNTAYRHNPPDPWLEFDCSEHPFREAVVETSFTVKDGHVSVPDGPGLGITVKEDVLVSLAR